MAASGLKHVGIALAAVAIRRSIESGACGRTWLESLPGAVGFYENMGRVRQGHRSAEVMNPKRATETNRTEHHARQARCRRIVVLLFIISSSLLSLFLAGCASPAKGLFPPSPSQPARTIYVLRRGLHTGIIVPAAGIPTNVWPEHKMYAGARYLEVGWGDSQGYRYPWTVGTVLRALFDSKGSVLLVHAFSGPVTLEYAGVAKQIIAVRLSGSGFARLCARIQRSYSLGLHGRPVPLPSACPWEDFYLAKGHYSLFNNCNNWTARALRAAGCPIAPRWCLLPQVVMWRTRHFGEVIWPRKDPQRAQTAKR